LAANDLTASATPRPPARATAHPERATGSRVVIAFDDPTVTSFGPIRRVAIEGVLAQLAEAGVRETDVQLICANALHRKFTRDELATIIGQDLVDRFGERLFCHDAEDAANLVYFGTTEHGYDVELSRHAVDADLAFISTPDCISGSAVAESCRRPLDVALDPAHAPPGRHVDVRAQQPHARRAERDGRAPRSINGQAHLQNRMRTVESNEDRARVGRRRLRDAGGGARSDGVAQSAATLAGGASGHRHVRATGVEPVRHLWNHEPNPDSDLFRTGISRRLHRSARQARLHRHPRDAVPGDWIWSITRRTGDGRAAVTRDPYEIMRRFGDEFATNAGYIERYRNGVAFHPVHAVLATHPLRRLKHASRVIVAGALDPAQPRHVGFEYAPSVEDAIRAAEAAHGADCSVVCVN
jgi:hypothetical protein